MTSACVLLATESVANLGFFDLFSKSTLFVSAGVLARIASVLLGGGMRLFPGGSIHLRIAILFILGLAAAPVAISVVQVQNVKEESFFPMMLSELLVGGCLGLSISFLVTVFESVGSVFANVTGLNWADVFTPGGSGGPGVTRLCGWVGLASFVLAGGQQFVVAGLIDSFLQMPVGALAGTNELFEVPIVMRLIELPSLCLQLALMISAPILVAVITAHLTATICMRSIAVTPGPGLMQGIAAAVMLGGLIVGSQQWAGHAGEILREPFEASFGSADSAYLAVGQGAVETGGSISE
ncbi:MAG TPA: hypothetical protein DEB70_10270 [Planctomycetaceae bacterium]|nr:hypothetical protein [Planctomycetaceae bacterium]